MGIILNKIFFCSLAFICLTIAGVSIGINGGNHNKGCETENKKRVFISDGKISMFVVYDNYQFNPDLDTGWGFGCVVRTPTQTILFDTGGNSSIMLSNMETLNIDPEKIDIVVISHIHGDHVGGLEGFLQRNCNVKVFIPS